MTSEVARNTMSDEPATTNNEQRPQQPTQSRWKRWFGRGSSQEGSQPEESQPEESQPERKKDYRPKSTLGILSDKQTDEVPGKLHRETRMVREILTTARNGLAAVCRSQ